MQFLEVKGLWKEFPGTTALNDVSCVFEQSNVHALLGKNGSGKSTFANIIAGIMKKTKGTIHLNGSEVNFSTPQEAISNGVVVVHQEMSLVSSLSVAENIFLGRLKTKNILGQIDWELTKKDAEELLNRVGININPQTMVSNLSIGQQQQIEIAKALSENPSLLILDEPTSALALKEVDQLFSIMRNLRNDGVTMIYISHRLQELAQIADTVTVLRDGKYIDKISIKEASNDKILQMMFGKVSQLERKANSDFKSEEKTPVLEVKGLTSEPLFQDINFTLFKGEVLGIAGLMGSGRTEIMRAIYGLDSFDAGEIYINGKKQEKIAPHVMKKLGISYVSEDRKEEGLISILSSHKNLVVASMEEKIAKNKKFITELMEKPLVKKQVDLLGIKVNNTQLPVSTLSGGNQQKIVVGNWLNIEPSIMFFDEPSRGIDVEAKQQIFEIIWEQKKKGIASIMVSSELEELHAVCDRILILRDGRFVESITPFDCTISELYAKCISS